MPKSLLKPPKGFKKPRVEDFKADMQRLGEDIASEFKDTIIENINSNYYGFSLAESTILRKGSDVPLVDTGELVDSIYADGTTVSVEDTPHSNSSLTNLELAIIQEYGTKDRHIPARPVWRKTFKDFKDVAQDRIETFLSTNNFDDNKHGGKHKVSQKKK